MTSKIFGQFTCWNALFHFLYFRGIKNLVMRKTWWQKIGDALYVISRKLIASEVVGKMFQMVLYMWYIHICEFPLLFNNICDILNKLKWLRFVDTFWTNIRTSVSQDNANYEWLLQRTSTDESMVWRAHRLEETDCHCFFLANGSKRCFAPYILSRLKHILSTLLLLFKFSIFKKYEFICHDI